MEKQVAVYNVGAHPKADMVDGNGVQIDFAVVLTECLSMFQGVNSCKNVPWVSYHFLLIASLAFAISKGPRFPSQNPRHVRYELAC